MTERWDTLLIDCRLATLAETGAAYGAIENAALGCKDGAITFAGPMSALPGRPDSLASQIESAGNAWITPGLVDCHTHLVFGGDRAHARNAGLLAIAAIATEVVRPRADFLQRKLACYERRAR